MYSKTYSITKARKNIFSIVDDVSEGGSYVALTDHGDTKAVIISSDEFESWIETFEIMKDFPTLSSDLKQAKKDFESGYYSTLEDYLKEQNVVLHDKMRNDVQNNTSNKSQKGSKENT